MITSRCQRVTVWPFKMFHSCRLFHMTLNSLCHGYYFSLIYLTKNPSLLTVLLGCKSVSLSHSHQWQCISYKQNRFYHSEPGPIPAEFLPGLFSCVLMENKPELRRTLKQSQTSDNEAHFTPCEAKGGSFCSYFSRIRSQLFVERKIRILLTFQFIFFFNSK